MGAAGGCDTCGEPGVARLKPNSKIRGAAVRGQIPGRARQCGARNQGRAPGRALASHFCLARSARPWRPYLGRWAGALLGRSGADRRLKGLSQRSGAWAGL